MVIAQSSVDQVLVHVLNSFNSHQKANSSQSTQRPFVIGLTGLQGSGKTTWTNALTSSLRENHGLKVVQVSLDDFYHNHSNLVKVREANPSNPLLRTRGQPGTHDESLILRFFSQLTQGHDVQVPAFDKSKFDGEGDRVPESEWEHVSSNPPIDIVIFEGWCVGFQALGAEEVERKWTAAKEASTTESTPEFSTTVLATLDLQHVLQINRNLKSYNRSFMASEHFDFFIHLDTVDLKNVYRWRLGQEHHMWQVKGQGMTDEEVIQFVRGYMSSYELYLERLRSESFVREAHLRIVLDKDRVVENLVKV